MQIRCSLLGEIMTTSRVKSDPLSETCKAKLIEIFVQERYGRNKFVVSRAIEKGLRVEEDGITLLSRLHKTFYVKNEKRYHNDYLTGTPDIVHDGIIIDIKSSWDPFTFYKNLCSSLNKIYYWQMMGYMALTGLKKAVVAYVLVDTPESIIDREKRDLEYKMGLCDPSVLDREFKAIDKRCRVDDIAMSERLITFDVERDEEAISSIYERIEHCREFLGELEESVDGLWLNTLC